MRLVTALLFVINGRVFYTAKLLFEIIFLFNICSLQIAESGGREAGSRGEAQG